MNFLAILDPSDSSISISKIAVLCVAAAMAGIVNSIAGGGTLLTFPALTWVLGPTAAAAVMANATSTIAVFPGSVASAWGYRRELAGMKAWILPLIVPSLVGSAIGTCLVSQRDPQEFLFLVPWLILMATSLFLLQPAITKWTGIGKPHATPSTIARYGIVCFQFMIAFYGGYFGAGIGILMLSSLALMGISNIHQMNAIKTLLASTINSVSVALFIWYDKVNWQLAIPMIIASILGGFLGAIVARRLHKNIVRYIVISIGIALSGYYFLQIYQGSYTT
jgi:uncharacterized protein